MKRFINSIKYLENWDEFWKFYYKSKKKPQTINFIAKLRSGLIAEVPSVLLSAFDEIFLREVYNSSFYTYQNNHVIIDIGANVGYFSLYTYSRSPKTKIISFEPLPLNLDLLNKHKIKNNLTDLIIDTRAVLGNKDSVEINYNPNLAFSVGASIIERNNISIPLKVKALSIPGIFKEYNLDYCNLMKMDCEGAEYDILQNCPAEYLQKINNLVIEVHSWVPEKTGTIPGLIKFLQNNNFVVRNRKNEILWCKKK